nr:hypothetical protein [Streptomyces sp. HNM0575]
MGRGAPASAGSDNTGSPPLPDLTGVDLHVLRVAEDPALRAAVDDVLRDPYRCTDLWWGPSDGGDTGKLHCVPAQGGTGHRTV